MAGAKDAREHWAKRSKKRVFSPACLKVTRPSFFFWGGGYHSTLKLSGIPTFTFIASLTHRMDNV